MKYIKAEIVRWVSDDLPGIVECSLLDANDRRWHFIEKVPVVTLEDLDSTSAYPRPALIGCEVLRATQPGLVEVTTERPWHIVSIDNVTSFTVRADQIVEEPWGWTANPVGDA